MKVKNSLTLLTNPPPPPYDYIPNLLKQFHTFTNYCYSILGLFIPRKNLPRTLSTTIFETFNLQSTKFLATRLRLQLDIMALIWHKVQIVMIQDVIFSFCNFLLPLSLSLSPLLKYVFIILLQQFQGRDSHKRAGTVYIIVLRKGKKHIRLLSKMHFPEIT